jgi:hypothetical protein
LATPAAFACSGLRFLASSLGVVGLFAGLDAVAGAFGAEHPPAAKKKKRSAPAADTRAFIGFMARRASSSFSVCQRSIYFSARM